MNISHSFTRRDYPARVGINLSIIARALATLRLWSQRSAARRQLRDLDLRLLQDVGISREQALLEARKPFWKP